MRNHWGENWNMKNIPNFREMGKSKLGKKFRIIKKSPMQKQKQVGEIRTKSSSKLIRGDKQP